MSKFKAKTFVLKPYAFLQEDLSGGGQREVLEAICTSALLISLNFQIFWEGHVEAPEEWKYRAANL